jgi:hypothetical protein
MRKEKNIMAYKIEMIKIWYIEKDEYIFDDKKKLLIKFVVISV